MSNVLLDAIQHSQPVLGVKVICRCWAQGGPGQIRIEFRDPLTGNTKDSTYLDEYSNMDECVRIVLIHPSCKN
jgi:hypothetical protein